LDRKEKNPIPLFANNKINMERNDVISSKVRYSMYPEELDKIILFLILVLAVCILFFEFIGVLSLQG
jgi:hypothetical protein